MREKFRVVLDTNILISALLRSPTCSTIMEFLKVRSFSLVSSESLLNEFREVLLDKKFTSLTDQEVRNLTIIIKINALIVNPTHKIQACRDPEDNKILEAAVSSNADFIVTGDKDLLTIKKIKNTIIITPKEFIHKLKSR